MLMADLDELENARQGLSEVRDLLRRAADRAQGLDAGWADAIQAAIFAGDDFAESLNEAYRELWASGANPGIGQMSAPAERIATKDQLADLETIAGELEALQTEAASLIDAGLDGEDSEQARQRLTDISRELSAMTMRIPLFDDAGNMSHEGRELLAQIADLQTLVDTFAGKSAAPRATKDDGRDYQAEIEAARERLQGLVEAATVLCAYAIQQEEGWDPQDILSGLMDISSDLMDLAMSVPVSDFDANPIPEGRELMNEIAAVQVWVGEQYGSIESGARPTLHSRGTPPSSAVRKSAEIAALERLAA
jgi:hypothetical protein